MYLFYYFGCPGFSLQRECWSAGASRAQTSHCSGFSYCGTQALGAGASAVAARGLWSCAPGAPDCTLSSWGTRAELLRGMWTLPGLGSESMSSAFAGGSIPPGKSSVCGLR